MGSRKILVSINEEVGQSDITRGDISFCFHMHTLMHGHPHTLKYLHTHTPLQKKEKEITTSLRPKQNPQTASLELK